MQHFKRPGVWLGIIAVLLAGSGSAYAAAKVTGKQVKDSSLTGKDIKNGSLSASELSDDALDKLQGTPGPAGPAGPAGVPGPSAVAAMTPVTSAQAIFPNYAASATAACPAGQRVVSGGGVSISPYGLISSQANASRTGWFVIGGTPDPSLTGQYVQAYALCAPAGVAVASSRSNDEAKIRAAVADANKRLAAMAAR